MSPTILLDHSKRSITSLTHQDNIIISTTATVSNPSKLT